MGPNWNQLTFNQVGFRYAQSHEFLDILKNLAHCDIPSKVDPNLLRPSDVTLQIPDTTKFTCETNWKPKYDFKQSVQHLLDYWRNEVKKS